jgi:hypothetical protein
MGTMMQTTHAKEERYGRPISFRHIANIRVADFVAWAVFSLDQRSLKLKRD